MLNYILVLVLVAILNGGWRLRKEPSLVKFDSVVSEEI